MDGKRGPPSLETPRMRLGVFHANLQLTGAGILSMVYSSEEFNPGSRKVPQPTRVFVSGFFVSARSRKMGLNPKT